MRLNVVSPVWENMFGGHACDEHVSYVLFDASSSVPCWTRAYSQMYMCCRNIEMMMNTNLEEEHNKTTKLIE